MILVHLLSYDIKSLSLGSSFLSFAFLPSAVLYFYCLSHSFTCIFFYNPLQPAPFPEVRMWLPVRWLNNDTSKQLTNRETPRVFWVFSAEHCSTRRFTAKTNKGRAPTQSAQHFVTDCPLSEQSDLHCPPVSERSIHLKFHDAEWTVWTVNGPVGLKVHISLVSLSVSAQ